MSALVNYRRQHPRLAAPEADIPAAILARNLLAPLTMSNMGYDTSNVNAPWVLHFEGGSSATISAFGPGVQVSAATNRGAPYNVQLWNQQRNILRNNTRYGFYAVVKMLVNTAGARTVTSEARDAGYANLGLSTGYSISDSYQLFYTEFTTQNYTDGQLNTLPTFYLGDLIEPTCIKRVALVTL